MSNTEQRGTGQKFTGKIAVCFLIIFVVSMTFGSPRTFASQASKLYKAISQHMENREGSFSVKTEYNSTVKYLVKACRSSDYDTFYGMVYKIAMAGDTKSSSDDGDYLFGLVSNMLVRYSGGRLRVNVKYFETKSQTKLVNRWVKAMAESICEEADTVYEKVELAHALLVDMIKYKASYSSGYQVFKSGKGNCNSYSLVFYKLMCKLNIPARFISGFGYTDGKWGFHAWNIVKVGGKWYNMDVTWDDMDDGEIYDDYFLLGQNAFKKDHRPQAMYKTSSFKAKYKLSAANY